MKLCEGRVAIVTGAGRGVGRAYALMLSRSTEPRAGDQPGSTPDGLAAMQRRVSRSSPKSAMRAARPSSTPRTLRMKAVQEMIRQSIESFGRLDVLINNAGILRDKLLINTSEDDWDTVIRVHLKGTFLPMHHAGNYWRSVQGRQDRRRPGSQHRHLTPVCSET